MIRKKGLQAGNPRLPAAGIEIRACPVAYVELSKGGQEI